MKIPTPMQSTNNIQMMNLMNSCQASPRTMKKPSDDTADKICRMFQDIFRFHEKMFWFANSVCLCARWYNWCGIFMNSFNKTAAAIFPIKAMLPEDFPFSQIITTLPMIKTLELFPYNNTINATHTNNIIIFVQHHLEQGKRYSEIFAFH